MSKVTLRHSITWGTAWRIARRELSWRFRGLRLLLVCLMLGTGALAAIGSLTGGIERELATRGRVILGGDVEAMAWQRLPNPAELRAFAKSGRVSSGVRLQAMATAGAVTVPVELKGVDEAWPLTGTLTLMDGRRAGPPPPGMAWLSQGAAQRLDLSPGQGFSIGGQVLRVGGIISDEPDRLSEGFSLGPVVIVDAAIPKAAGLLAPGAMFRSKTRIALTPGRSPQAVVDDLERRFPDAGFTFRTRDKASPGAERFVSRMGDFLVLVGLAALVIAGIGIGLGVTSYLDARRPAIATLKVLGASSRDIARICLLQVGAAALAGSLAGLASGIAVTPLAARSLSGMLPVSDGLALDPAALVRAMAYGLLIAVIFATPPLMRARRFPAMALLRSRVADNGGKWIQDHAPAILGMGALVAMVLATSSQPALAAGFVAGALVLLGLLGGLGMAVRQFAARLPRPRNPLLRAGLANLHRPGAQTAAVVTALGFGLSAFVLMAALQTSLDANIRQSVPARAPAYFALDVPRDGEARFRATIATLLPGARVHTVPALRGRILAYGQAGAMVRNRTADDSDDGPWQLRGERGLTYAENLPEGSAIVEGHWWPNGYSGEPLVSVDIELAEPLGLQIGDMLTIGLLGVERTARIASFRRIDWDTMGFNYVLVFSPNALRDAPHNFAATINAAPKALSNARTRALLQHLAREFPSTSMIETNGLLDQARLLLMQVSDAILAAASIVVLAGLAVLLGAISAARASRLYDNVILRILGASRRQLMALQLVEYGLLALLLAGVGLALGSGAAWLVCVKLFDFEWLPDWPLVLGVLGAGVALVTGFALSASLPLLRARPASALREL